MISVAICDDEKYFSHILKNMISTFMTQRGIKYSLDMFDSGNELLSYLSDNAIKTTVVFLDINMEDMDGIETATRIRKLSKDVYIVFVTAYIKYSLEGYKVKAIRYLIKGDVNFEKSLEECMDAILDNMNYGIQTVSFEFKDGKRDIVIDNIIYIESNLHTLRFVMRSASNSKEEFIMIATLNEAEENLKDFGLVRIHQSYLINLNHVKTVNAQLVIMDNGDKLSVSRSKYKSFKEALARYMGEF